MSELLEKISSYNIFNYLLPGVLFAVIGSEMSSYKLLTEDLAVGAFLYYFYGLVISRIGSVAIEPTLKFVRFIRFAQYSDFVAAVRIDPKLDILSEQNNSYRTLSSLCLCLLLLIGFEKAVVTFKLEHNDSTIAGVAILLILFALAYRKQTNYITCRIASVLNSVKGESKNETNNS